MLIEGGDVMRLEVLSDNTLEEVRVGAYYDVTLLMGLVSVLAILISVYKLYASSKGKARFGNDYTFEWS